MLGRQTSKKDVKVVTTIASHRLFEFVTAQTAPDDACSIGRKTLHHAGHFVSRNILLIQYDPVDATAVREALVNSIGGPFEVEWVRSCAEGQVRLRDDAEKGQNRNGIAAVLVDLFLPDSSGIQTFDQLFLAAPQIPILVLCDSQ